MDIPRNGLGDGLLSQLVQVDPDKRPSDGILSPLLVAVKELDRLLSNLHILLTDLVIQFATLEAAIVLRSISALSLS